MRIIDGNTIETECDSCACTFTTTRGEDGGPDDILCMECTRTWEELLHEFTKERDRVWLETFLSFPFKALPAPTCDHWGGSNSCDYCGSPNHEEHYCPEIEDLWRQGVPHYE